MERHWQLFYNSEEANADQHILDLARDIYYNATLNGMDVIRFIIDREKKAQHITAEWLKQSMVRFLSSYQ